MQLVIRHQTECHNDTCPKHDGIDEPIVVCDRACPTKQEPRIFQYNNMYVYGIDEEGVHHTTDARFYEYMIAREETPKKVVVHTTLKEFKAAMHV